MALITLKFYSEALEMQTEVYVAIPQRSSNGEIGIGNNAGDGKYKCLYLLHGLSDDHTIWLRRTSIERYAADYGICVVMPCGGRSFYTDMKYGAKYYSYIAKELPRVIGEFFNVSDKREDTYIAGLSMGGYGALKIALRENDRFCAAAGLSSVADIYREDFKKTLVPVFGDNIEIPREDDLFSLVEMKNTAEVKPRLFMTIGTEDFMYEDNLRLKAKIEELDYDYTYTEDEGVHTWSFWDDKIKTALKWMFEK